MKPGSSSYIPVESERNRYQSTSTAAPPMTPATAPLYVNRLQNRVSSTTGPNAEPNPPHAFSTISIIACAPEPLLDAMKYAITATMSTMIRPTHMISLSEASFLNIGLYISDVNELDATSSCESAVDIDAAIIADSRNPAISPGNIFLMNAMNTIFCDPVVSSSSASTILPKYAMRHVAVRDSITQIIATVALFFIIDGFSIDMNLTRM